MINKVEYHGWVYGTQKDIPKLKLLGVRGKLTHRNTGKDDVIEHCVCNKIILKILIKTWPKILPEAFTPVNKLTGLPVEKFLNMWPLVNQFDIMHTLDTKNEDKEKEKFEKFNAIIDDGEKCVSFNGIKK